VAAQPCEAAPLPLSARLNRERLIGGIES